jgi:uncharacterized damage-inducible protein DinB
MAPPNELAALFRRDLTRLIQQLEAFPDTAALWRTAPGVSNSAGNLALHLEGNLREYVGRQLGEVPYRRDRAQEFAGEGIEKPELVKRIQSLGDMIPLVIASLSAGRLDEAYPEQVFGGSMSTRMFLHHLLTHFSYHLGQIDYLRRFLTKQGALQLVNL